MSTDNNSDESYTVVAATQTNETEQQHTEAAAITNDIFPKFKFIDDKKMEFSKQSKSICQRLARSCFVQKDDVPKWWKTMKKFTKAKIQTLRTTRQAAIKKDFIGT